MNSNDIGTTFYCYMTVPKLGRPIYASIGVASYGALGHVPPPPQLPASYFGDHSLTDSDESCARFSVQ